MENTSEKTPTEQPKQQTDTAPAVEQTKPKQQTDTAPAAEQTKPKQTSDKQSPSSQEGTKPFNPYDMKALKRFDAGDHRAKE